MAETFTYDALQKLVEDDLSLQAGSYCILPIDAGGYTLAFVTSVFNKTFNIAMIWYDGQKWFTYKYIRGGVTPPLKR